LGRTGARRDAAESLRDETGCEIFQCNLARREDREALIGFARERLHEPRPAGEQCGDAPRYRRDILEATEESFDELMAVNLKGPYFLTQQAARWMAGAARGASCS